MVTGVSSPDTFSPWTPADMTGLFRNWSLERDLLWWRETAAAAERTRVVNNYEGKDGGFIGVIFITSFKRVG